MGLIAAGNKPHMADNGLAFEFKLLILYVFCKKGRRLFDYLPVPVLMKGKTPAMGIAFSPVVKFADGKLNINLFI